MPLGLGGGGKAGIYHIDQRDGELILDGEEIADVLLREPFPQRPLQQLVDGLVERFLEDV